MFVLGPSPTKEQLKSQVQSHVRHIQALQTRIEIGKKRADVVMQATQQLRQWVGPAASESCECMVCSVPLICPSFFPNFVFLLTVTFHYDHRHAQYSTMHDMPPNKACALHMQVRHLMLHNRPHPSNTEHKNLRQQVSSLGSSSTTKMCLGQCRPSKPGAGRAT